MIRYLVDEPPALSFFTTWHQSGVFALQKYEHGEKMLSNGM